MTFGFRFDIVHPIYGWIDRATKKIYAIEIAQKLADKEDSEYIVYDRLARKGKEREFRVKPRSQNDKA